MHIRLKFLSLVVGCLVAQAATADWCRYSRELSLEIDVRGVEKIEVIAVSGDLSVEGEASLDPAVARGRACVERKYRDRLDEIKIVEERAGSLLRIIAEVPYVHGGTHGGDWRIGSLDLSLQIPKERDLLVTDSSGDIQIRNVKSVQLTDSSGDILLENIEAEVHIKVDSSGDIDIREAGVVEISVDSSGDIDVRHATSLQIGRDSSGSIVAQNIEGSVAVGFDSSGDIRVSDIGGDFTVGNDGSGDIRHRGVAGSIDIPEGK